MIEAVAPVGRVDAALVAAAGASASRRLERRQKRLRWLGALHDALGEAGPPADALENQHGRGDAPVADTRACIAAALDTVAEMRALMSGGAVPESAPERRPADAAEVARHLVAEAGRALAIQACLGGRAVRHLLGATGGDAVNRA